MSMDTEQSAQLVAVIPDEDRPGLIDEPTTPRDDDSVVPSSQHSQQSMPSTQGPNSPRPASPFKDDLNDRLAEQAVIPSSLTPPPSSQVPNIAGAGAINPLGYIGSQRLNIFSPPATGFNGVKRDAADATEFTAPTAQQIAESSPDELRAMLQGCIADNAKLKMEAAHHKLQFNLLSIQSSEDSKRAAVEHEMTRKEVEALRIAEHSRQARRDLSAASESVQPKYLQLKMYYDQAVEENDVLAKRFKAARKVIQQKEDEIIRLTDDRDLLMNRIRENREHFHHLCSPGGLFHGVMSPKSAQQQQQQAQPAAATPVQNHRSTPRQTPKSAAAASTNHNHRDPRVDHHRNENFAVLLQALSSQENNSAPSTPITGHRPVPSRMPAKHTRNVQSMSSLPTTPVGHSRLETTAGGLLPSVNLVPQTEPRYRNSRLVPETPPPPPGRAPRDNNRRSSRESTISAEDNAELARQALQLASFARGASASQQQRLSHSQPHSQSRTLSSRRHTQLSAAETEDEVVEEEVFESQASQAASEMLRRDPRESFEVARSVGNSRDGTPAVAPAADKSSKLQAKLFGGLNKSGVAGVAGGGVEKRKFSSTGGSGSVVAGHGERNSMGVVMMSPTKKLRVAGGLRDPGQIGLGIQYSQ